MTSMLLLLKTEETISSKDVNITYIMTIHGRVLLNGPVILGREVAGMRNVI